MNENEFTHEGVEYVAETHDGIGCGYLDKRCAFAKPLQCLVPEGAPNCYSRSRQYKRSIIWVKKQ